MTRLRLVSLLTLTLLTSTPLSAVPIVFTFTGIGSGTRPDGTSFSDESVMALLETDTTVTGDSSGRFFNLPHAWQVGGNLFVSSVDDGFIQIQAGGGGIARGGDDGLVGGEPRFAELAPAAPSLAFTNPAPFAAVPYTLNNAVGGSVDVLGGTLTFSSLEAQTVGAELGSIPEPTSLGLAVWAVVGGACVRRRRKRKA